MSLTPIKTNSNINRRKSEFERILIFDLSIDGHHPGYILHLIQYWNEQNLSGYLDIIVKPDFVRLHKDVVNVANRNNLNQINFIQITQLESDALASPSNLISRKKLNFQEWQLFCKYTKLLRSTQALLMYFDTYQLPSLLGEKPLCPTSAIYFRPRFHYNEFEDCNLSWQDRYNQKLEKLYLALVLRNPIFKTIFCLDPFVLNQLKLFKTKNQAIYLPDPVRKNTASLLTPDKIKSDFGMDSTRKVFLLFGGLNSRKGLFQLLDALFLIPSDICEQISVLLVGPISLENKAKVENIIARLKNFSTIEIFLDGRFICDRDIQPYFQAADFVLAPYQRHVGMSAILVRAATAQKPVLSSNYGLMGKITSHYKLGLTVDSTIPDEIATGITQLMSTVPNKICDYVKMNIFAEQNEDYKFAQVIFQSLSNQKI